VRSDNAHRTFSTLKFSTLSFGLEGAVDFIEGFDNSTLKTVDVGISLATAGTVHLGWHLQPVFNSSNPYVNWDYTFGGAFGTAYGFGMDDANIFAHALNIESLAKYIEWDGAAGVAHWVSDALAIALRSGRDELLRLLAKVAR
jgi:hypothetical protein